MYEIYSLAFLIAHNLTIGGINFTLEAVAFFAHTYVFTKLFNIVYTFYILYTYIMSSLFADFRYNVTCGWFSFVGLSMFDVGCYCWLLGV